MESLLHEEEDASSRLSRQAVSFVVHILLALATWVLLMLLGYALNPQSASQLLILILSVAVPLAAGFAINRFRQDDMAPTIWLFGLIWMLILSLWILDMPTGPNQCLQCGATEKLTRTFFSLPSPSGLIDNDGPFFATWPCAALVGYSIGAKLALRKRS